MPRPRRRTLLIALAALLCLTLVLGGRWWTSRPGPELPALTLGTGGEGGVYALYGATLAASLSRDGDPAVRAVNTAASVENLQRIAAGELDAGFTLLDVAALAVEGREPFDRPLPIAAIARLYDNRIHLVVPADGEARRVADLAGRRVSVGDSGSGTELMADRLLALADIDPETGIRRQQLAIGASVAALREGRIDAFFWSGGIPTGAVADLADQMRLRVVDLSEHVGALREAHGAFFSDVPVPAETYPHVPGVRTVGVPSILVVHADLADATARALTSGLFGARGDLAAHHPTGLRLSHRSAIATWPVPLHPGAVEHYRNAKEAYRPERPFDG
ncbi:TAXI family TRAP transporter solute-binding subunit [Nocardioides sp.]|uniref:TAXI family TRAP transporter solute-binding subunit n=1 Tax=Nocardioides sp. TaxID=35761 RepID=UPI002733A176|nr:TAXI family TRAP transporter solute-binding subunit [Nocardioides sp.]MDP3891793.1 TAXI family TRAP transporter solute-binding subunit [Nocardioides sp.]